MFGNPPRVKPSPIRSRLDLEITRRGLALSREVAQRLIMAGRVRVNSRPAAKADLRVTEACVIEVIGAPREYASRGAYKLLAALDHFDIAVAGRRCLDIGASTGGFTDVLLQRGAAHVLALDVGYGQLIDRLRTDPRVSVIDRTNIRFVEPEQLPYTPELITVDASFISLRLVLPAVARLIAAPADIVALIKPQFEVGKGKVDRGGIVRDTAARLAAVADVLACAQRLGLTSRGFIESPITGAAGNHEYLAALHFA